MTAIIPIPRCPITIRPATPADLPFIDSLQKQHTRQVGWMPTKQIEQKIAAGNVLVAEEVGSGQWAVGREEEQEAPESADRSSSPLPTADCRLPTTPIGYLIATDRYFKRDDVGIIYQLAVAASARRGLVGATLLKAQFARSAYGCRLYCCWCAQDIEANRFWESMGFVPLAFRAGSRDKGRVHIFWQRRTRAGDTTTPWWFPAKTDAGAMREDRLVLPIPPGTHWSDELPALLPEVRGQESEVRSTRRLTSAALVPGTKSGPQKPTPNPRARVQFGPPDAQPAVAVEEHVTPGAKPAKAKAKVKADPKLVAAARELRDRYLERINSEGYLPSSPAGKYDVGRSIGPGVTPHEDEPTRLPAGPATKLLPAA